MKKTIRRHGDLPIYPVEKLPKGKEIKHSGSFVLAEGTTTGHKHLLSVKKPSNLTIYEVEKELHAISLKTKGMLSHEEHKTIMLEPGLYVIGREQEFDHFSQAVQKVID